jgi:hypothetical protein
MKAPQYTTPAVNDRTPIYPRGGAYHRIRRVEIRHRADRWTQAWFICFVCLILIALAVILTGQTE